MAAETFWNNREQAQKLIDEAGSLRRKLDPLLDAEKKFEDLQVMTELVETEPEADRAKLLPELTRDMSAFTRQLEQLELRVLLAGPHDRCNCIFSINAGAGGTEAQDWAEMLSRMYQRWFEGREWEVEVTDALPGEGAGLKKRDFFGQRRKRLRLLQGGTRRPPPRAHFAVRLQSTTSYQLRQRRCHRGN
jgi:peptide chain release factor 2